MNELVIDEFKVVFSVKSEQDLPEGLREIFHKALDKEQVARWLSFHLKQNVNDLLDFKALGPEKWGWTPDKEARLYVQFEIDGKTSGWEYGQDDDR